MQGMRIGHGYDVHRLVEGRRLILGGVDIPWERGLLGHSDADVLTHAVMDALLGAAGLRDIGTHFPDTDPACAGADSLRLLEHVAALLREPAAQAGSPYPRYAGEPGPGHGGGPRAGQREGHHRGGPGLHRLRRGHGRPRGGAD